MHKKLKDSDFNVDDYEAKTQNKVLNNSTNTIKNTKGILKQTKVKF